MVKINNSAVKKLIQPSYAKGDLERIKAFFAVHNTLRFHINDKGLYAALSTDAAESVSGYTYAWVRDTVMVTNYQRETGNYPVAVRTMRTLRNYFHKHRNRFCSIIEGRTDRNAPMQRPHVRFNRETLEEVDQKWAHAQNDALGYALWMVCKLANSVVYEMEDRDYEVYSLFPPYFKAIEYWHDRDSGHWEEDRKVNTSSIGVVVAALEEMKRFIESKRAVRFVYNRHEIAIEELQELIGKGRAHLERTLPFESPPLRMSDAALLFLIYPLEIVTEQQEDEIIRTVLAHLKGDYGIKRYIGDSFWCADYKKLFGERERTEDFSDDIERRNRVMIPGTEAQWCIFDPVLSVIYGKRFLATGENEYKSLQTHFFNRSLAQLTPEDFYIGGGLCPEAYYIEDSSKGVYVPNDQTPLAWTQANLGIAFAYMQKTCI